METELNKRIDEIKTTLPIKDQRFYHIDRLERIVRYMTEHEKVCDDCKSSLTNIENLLISKDQLFDDSKGRKSYENVLDQSIDHLQNGHGIYRAFYFTYKASTIGLIIGLFFGTIQIPIFHNANLFMGLTMLGVIIGYFIGNRKDNLLRYQRKII